MKITIVSGARPNFMKIAPICRAIDAAREAGKKISYRLVYTGPQDDTSLDASLFSDLAMKRPDAYLGISGHDHSQVAAAIMLAFEKELDANPAQVVLVVDDMTATMSCAIVAKKRGLKVAHVIAGTRSFDMNMPREVNRTIVDAISDYLFTAGMVANRNLNQEGMIPEYIHYVGNILIDTIRYNRHRLIQPLWFPTLGLRKGNYLLLTLNRRDLLEKKAVLHSLLQTLIEKADGMPIVAPLHPYVEKAVKSLDLNISCLHKVTCISDSSSTRPKVSSPIRATSPKKLLSLMSPASLSTLMPSILKPGASEPMNWWARIPLRFPPHSTNC